MNTWAHMLDWMASDAKSFLNLALEHGGSGDVFAEATERIFLHSHRHGRSPAQTTISRDHIEGIALYVTDGQSTGFASRAGLSTREFTPLAEHARLPAGSRTIPAIHAITTPHKHPITPPDALPLLAEAELKALATAAMDAAFSQDPAVHSCTVVLQGKLRRTIILTSEGFLVPQLQAWAGLKVSVGRRQGDQSSEGEAMSGGPFGAGHFFKDLPEEVSRRAVAQAIRLKDAQPLKLERGDAVLAGAWGGVFLHEAIGHALEADIGYGQVGDQVGLQDVTLLDDPTFADGRASASHDDEGFPATPTLLIQDGLLAGHLTDRHTAAATQTQRTGNGRRQDYRFRPLPRMTNLVMPPGTAAEEDLIAQVEDGLYIVQPGVGIFQPHSAHFLLSAREAYRIKKGRLAAPVTGISICGDSSKPLAGLAGIGSTQEHDASRGVCVKAGQVLPVSTAMPSVRLNGMNFIPTPDIKSTCS